MRSALLLMAAAGAAFAHVTYSTKLTWSKEVSRIVAQRCLSCHSAGGAAPFALETYEQARPWAKAIQEEVLTRRMPPWGAVKGFGEFANDQGLTQAEIGVIADWVEGGAPEGDIALLPPKSPLAPEPARPRGIATKAPLRIASASLLTALRTAEAAQVTAELPDGSFEALLWIPMALKAPRTFVLAAPLLLPTGSRIRSSAPVTAYLTAPSRPRRNARYSQVQPGRTEPRHDGAPAGGRSR